MKINIAIDGFSSCGKSTLAKALASKLHYLYLDTGSMYRAIGLYAQRNGMVDAENNPLFDLLIPKLDQVNIGFVIDETTGQSKVLLNGEQIESYIRDIHIASLASKVSKHRQVRNKLQVIQREMAAQKGVIMDGRDIGTVVMPDADLKIYMVANPEIRAERRFLELQASGKEISMEEVVESLKKRDFDDTTREEDPLKKAEDAMVLDNSYLSQEEQLNLVIHWVNEVSGITTPTPPKIQFNS